MPRARRLGEALNRPEKGWGKRFARWLTWLPMRWQWRLRSPKRWRLQSRWLSLCSHCCHLNPASFGRKLAPATSRSLNYCEWLSAFWTNWSTFKANLVACIGESATGSVCAFTILDGHTVGLSAKSRTKKQCNSVKLCRFEAWIPKIERFGGKTSRRPHIKGRIAPSRGVEAGRLADAE